MKKIEFYTRTHKNGKDIAEKVNGYTDGKFNYYKNEFGNWFAVEPKTGLSTGAQYKTRKQIIDHAYSERVTALIEAFYKKPDIEDGIKYFNSLIQEAENVRKI